MNINEIISSGVEMNITFKASDLREFADLLVKRTVKELLKTSEGSNVEYLTVEETAKVLRTHRSTLWGWSKKGILTPLEIGGRRLYRKSDVYELLKKNNGHE